MPNALQNPRLVSSVYGKIQHVAFSCSDTNKRKAALYLESVRDFITKVDDDVVISICIHPKPKIINLFAKLKKDFPNREIHPLHFKFTRGTAGHDTYWIQDEFLAHYDQKNPNKRALAESKLIPCIPGDELHVLAAEHGMEHTRTPIYITGGNILVGEKHVLVGLDELKRPDGRSLMPLEEYKTNFKKDVDHSRMVITLGKVRPPKFLEPFNKLRNWWRNRPFHKKFAMEDRYSYIYHLDVYLNFAGICPKTKKMILVIGNPVGVNSKPQERLRNRLNRMIRQQLDDRLFLVKRIDLPFVNDLWFASYNNAIVEIIDDRQKRIWLPTYGKINTELEKYDQKARCTWEKLDFKVIQLGDYSHFQKRRVAGPHCFIKVLSRHIY